MFDDFEPIAFLYGGCGLLVGVIMVKFGMSSIHINFVWKILTVLATTFGAFVLGMIQSGD